MATVEGGPVRPHVQAFADAVNERTGITHIMTYPGHEPTQDRALDIFATRELGDVVAQFAIDNIDHYGITYVIWRQRIYNPRVGRPYWRQMEDRGSITQNHFDHVHLSFEPTGAAAPGGSPAPAPAPHPKPEEVNMNGFIFSHAGDQWLAWEGKKWKLNSGEQVAAFTSGPNAVANVGEAGTFANLPLGSDG